ncbi:multiple RNA-binding domain-containing protein 1-like isoform X2 [Telopea speciosissima]|uniref:multiple RNA-binding domain-containing protein 1-like isoform X2 n=1 Tax=Telopea speciosissima TaxID=54955 RepID=UPI001CC66729|nr:multiple RNA-binding domain-containing protein 1-like isoform X2 [Telopea speciosissima]
MSRVCVKNLPKYVAEDRLREFFSQKGEVTDAKLMRTKDGKSRQFAFIGFRTEGEAEEALKFFNNSYLDNSRLTCEVARKVGDPNMPRPWSQYSATKQEKVAQEKKENIGSKSLSHVDTKGIVQNSKRSSENNDPQLQEFLQVMQPRIKSKLWANDSVGVPLLEPGGKAGTKQKRLDEAEVQQSGSNQVEYDENDKRENGSSNAHAAKQSDNALNDEVVSDMDYFKSRVKRQWSDSESDDDSPIANNDHASEELDMEEQCEANQNELPKDKVKKGASSENFDGEGDLSSGLKDAREEVLETGRLFVRNLPYSATEDDLAELFSKFGNVSQVHLVVDKDTKRSKGFAYVLYTLPESALRALEELDNSIFQGRLLHIMPAKQQNPSEKQDVAAGQASKTFKQQREEQRKASEASGDTQAWNSLFTRADTVVENIARTLGVDKSDLLDREADDLAVRIALGETQVIAETKNALNNLGVNVTALEALAVGKTVGTRRSSHVILVKNLPYGSSEGDLAKMFGKFGSLDKIILPPTKTLALVVFLEAAEARAAFKGLAYKRYKDAPLYLEWAPNDVLSLSATSETKSQSNAIVGEKDVKRVLLEQRVEGLSEVDIDPDRIESRSLFVKNLNFKTSDESLRKHFSENVKEGKIQSIRIKKHLKNGNTLSMGFGFIEFDSVETGTNVCRDLQGTVLDGHALILQLCHAKKDGQVAKKVDKDRSSTKLIVRNVAFEATEKELRQLFSPFGQIKSLRLPMKLGSHRGFAFVEYVTKQEAQNALQALASTHLYGRHLVLERAKEGESLEELRARTAAQFTDEQNGFQNPTKLSKKRKQLALVEEGNIKFQRIAA